MSRIVLLLIGGVLCAVGLGFVIGGGAHWLAIHYGAIASDFIVGGLLLVAGLLIVTLILVYRPAPAMPQHEQQSTRGALAALPERIFRSLSPEDLQGLALLCQRRPMVASLVALALGVGIGLDRPRARRR